MVSSSSVGLNTTGTNINWNNALDNIPNNAQEPILYAAFIPHLLKALGFNQQEWFPQFATGNGGKKVDYAVRKNIDNNLFRNNPINPYLLIEVKGRATNNGVLINLASETPKYKQTKEQIKRYLLDSKCQSAQWGIITNATHIQLFRRHGKVVFPATQNYLIKKNNINEIINNIKILIDNPDKALSICVYNDKGGVGKTTTVANLATVLARKKKKVLVIDFDSQQGDLTASLNKKEGMTKLSDCLIDRKINVCGTIQKFQMKFNNKFFDIFDLIPSDSQLAKYMEPDEQAKIQGGSSRLKHLIEPLRKEYDYIIFDCPTNWTFFSQSCVYAADVVLIPTQQNNFASLKNSKTVIQKYIPEIQSKKGDGTPIALPIFLNNYNRTPAVIERTHKYIESLLTTNNQKINLDLLPYYYPKYIPGNFNKSIFGIPESAWIAIAGFNGVPSAITYKIADESYLNGSRSKM